MESWPCSRRKPVQCGDYCQWSVALDDHQVEVENIFRNQSPSGDTMNLSSKLLLKYRAALRA